MTVSKTPMDKWLTSSEPGCCNPADTFFSTLPVQDSRGDRAEVARLRGLVDELNMKLVFALKVWRYGGFCDLNHWADAIPLSLRSLPDSRETLQPALRDVPL